MKRGGDYGGPFVEADAIKAAQAQFGDFCETVAKLSNESPPPAPNAANGYFREAMWSGKELVPLAAPYPHEDSTKEGKALYGLIVSFGQGLKGAFAPENVSATGWTNGALFKASIDQLGKDVANVVGDIVGLFTGKADPTKLKADIDALIQKTRDLPVKLNGTHMNGWIQPNVKNVAASTSSQADALAKSLTDPEAQKVATGIKGVCDKIVAIPDFKNDPWLYGEWQLEFQAIMSAAALSAKAA